jgi:SRSO17 transposase
MTARQEKTRQNLVQIVSYFKGIMDDYGAYPRRQIEYEISLATAELISAKSDFTKKDFLAIAACVNQIIGQDHANGCGWYDFQLKVSGFYRAFGYKSDWDSATGEFTFWKEDFNLWNWLEEARLALK